MQISWRHITFVLALAGCSNDFTPYSQLDRLRVLAIQAEPATPLPGETAAISALTFVPPGEAAAYRWSWCPATALAASDYACPLDDAQAAQAFAAALDGAVAAKLPSLDLGTDATAAFTNPFALSALARLCAEGLNSPVYAQSFDCAGGFPATVVLDVTTATTSLRAGFVLRLPVGVAPEINHNPIPTGLQLADALIAEAFTTIPVSPSQTLDLHVDIPAGAAETRSIPPSEGPPGQRLERLTASWFADSGSIDKTRTAFIDGTTRLEETAQNKWTAPLAAAWPANGQVEFAVVLRDDRGGVGWMVRHIVLGQAP